MGLSVGMITHNEARRIRRTLEAVRGWASEIVVVDAMSTDGTQEICRALGARVIEREWPGYGAQKNAVMELCENDWVLLLDADEVVTPALRAEIDGVLADPDAGQVYTVRYDHYVYGRLIRNRSWHGAARHRLLRKGSGSWSEVPVHEGYVTTHPSRRLTARLEHYPYLDRSHFQQKQHNYTRLEAEMAYERGEAPHLLRTCVRSAYGFLRELILQQGYRDGAVGVEMALQHARYFLLRDRKLSKLYRDRGPSDRAGDAASGRTGERQT